MERTTWLDDLRNFRPCQDALQWAAGFDTFDAAWQACERGDWMLWILGKLSGPPESERRKKLALAAADCAELSLPVYEKRYPNDPRVRDCIRACRNWANGNATIEELRKARMAAAYAAAAAADAADAAAAYAAADAAAYAAARTSVLKQCAEIARKRYPHAPNLTP